MGEMAEDVLDKVIERKGLKAGPCLTDKRPLRGGVGYTKNVPIQLVQEFGVSEETAKHLATSYGMNAFDVCKMAKPSGKAWPKFGNVLAEGHPHLECEIEYQCKNEMRPLCTTCLLLACVWPSSTGRPRWRSLPGWPTSWHKRWVGPTRRKSASWHPPWRVWLFLAARSRRRWEASFRLPPLRTCALSLLNSTP